MNSKLSYQAFAAVARPSRCSRIFAANSQCARHFSRSAIAREEGSQAQEVVEATESEQEPTPRWKETPPAMKAPVRLRAAPGKKEYVVNSDPLLLDHFYIRFLGPEGDKMLSEETKWQAVTHKSFDQGRRGFNDRLGYLGKQIVGLQATLAQLENGPKRKPQADTFGREPFQHPALERVEILADNFRQRKLHSRHVGELAHRYGLHEVLRWLPWVPDNMALSGHNLILTHTLYAIVGAVAMEKGGLVANQVAREKILKPLGFFSKR
ncbi:Ribonuclease III [Ascosphaera apis ARSEF 7405]|uniref:Ribonuclease III n=1 Tax=Ascosphaera apis ARSEF 7405 TaxID=392613 RepID=A0A168B0S6_9EURO|nr:Ribonuclease III [Ascosphaera apis ARSEF 7405]